MEQRSDNLDDLRPGTSFCTNQESAITLDQGLAVAVAEGSKIEVTHPLGAALLGDMMWVRTQIGLSDVEGRISPEVLRKLRVVPSVEVQQ